MEFNLYKHTSNEIYDQWVRFPATVLGMSESGPFVDLWRQQRREFKDAEKTVVNSDLGKVSVSLADIADPTTEMVPMLNPLTGETLGEMSVAEFISRAYSFAIWLDLRNEAAVAAVTTEP